MSRARDRRKANAREAVSAPAVARHAPRCTDCGEPGPHYAPPSLGEPGFYTCQRRAVTR